MMRALLLLALLLTGCGASRSDSEQLRDAVRDYIDLTRWGAWDRAAGYVIATRQGEWLTQRAANARGLAITDVALQGIQPIDEKGEAYHVFVVLNWYRAPDTTVHSAVWRTEWRLVDREWRIVDESPVQPQLAGPDEPPPSWP